MAMQPITPKTIIIAFILIILLVMIQIEVFGLVLNRLGISRDSASFLLLFSFLGSAINLPLLKIRSNFDPETSKVFPRQWLSSRFQPGFTQVAINVGGGLIPTGFSIFLLWHSPPGLIPLLLATGMISLLSFLFSRPVENLGIAMPLFIAPASAAILAMLLSSENAPVLAYVSGTLGVLIGADVLRIGNIRQLNTPVASIGGAGTFDGIFMTGIIAVILTY